MRGARGMSTTRPFPSSGRNFSGVARRTASLLLCDSDGGLLGRGLRFVAAAVLELHETFEGLINLKVHLRLAGDERAPGRAAAPQVERQARGVRVVAGGDQFGL